MVPADDVVVDAGHGEHGERLHAGLRRQARRAGGEGPPGGLVVRLMDGDPAIFNGLAEEARPASRRESPWRWFRASAR